MSDIKQELEKALEAKHLEDKTFGEQLSDALWAAKWMAERIAKEAYGETARDIHQLAKEL